jgi:hypothetical protein
MAFQDTPNKATIRQKWDLPILISYADELGRKLAYFGLPGVETKDLLDWREVLGHRTGVELLHKSGARRQDELRAIDQLQLSIMLNHLDSDWQLLRGDIEDVILNGYDIDGTPPALNDGDVPHRRLYQYDLYNLDFLGGIGYADVRGESKRIRAIRKLFDRQRGHDFLLLLTINVRDTVGGELSDYLCEVSEDYDDSELGATLHWYAETGRAMKKYKLKAALPICLQEFARNCSFNCFCYPPLAYSGHNALLVHFVFQLGFVPGRNFPVPRQQRVEELVNLPLVEVEGGGITVAGIQHPGFDHSQCEKSISFLPSDTRQIALAGAAVQSAQ